MAKLQCDFSAPMFEEFMVPILTRMTEGLDYCMYHWDGLSALQHRGALLSIPKIRVIQWTPGAGVGPPDQPRYWQIYHKTVDAGKGVYIGSSHVDALRAMRCEFGRRLNSFVILAPATLLKHADELSAAVGE